MKHTKVLISLVVMTVIFLTGCGEVEKEETEVNGMKELVFLEKTKDYLETSFIFESSIDEKYYLIEVSNWDYDNTTFQNGDILNLESKEKENTDLIGSIIFDLSVDNVYLPEEEVLMFDEWKSLFILKDYTKSE